MNRITIKIHLDQYKANLKRLAASLPTTCCIMAIVKADAYGHGAIDVAKAAIEEQVRYLGVATISEYNSLYQAGINYPTLLLSEPVFIETDTELAKNLTYTVYTIDFIKRLEEFASRSSNFIKIHLKVDTGMNRLGIHSRHTSEMLSLIQKCPHLYLEGLYTHLSQSEISSSGFTQKQLKDFLKIRKLVEVPLIHSANSGGIRYFPDSYFSMVRVGLDSYQNVMEVMSRVLLIKDIPAGESVGYDAQFTASENINIAIISAGYADGISTSFKTGHVFIKGNRYPIIGKICMDMFMVNLGNNDMKVRCGDEVTILGRTSTTLEEWAAISGLNPREITCLIGNGKRSQKRD